MEEILGYRVLETLHEGRGIHVFRAEHKNDHSLHIVKTLLSGSPEQVAAFRHEYQINHNLQMQGLVHCQQLIEKGDKRLLVFEDAGGTTLLSYLGAQSLDLHKFFPIAIEMVISLEELHNNKVIHKDIKPANILIDPETFAIKFLDLGIATQLANETHEAVSVDKLEGSLAYIAPEQTGRMNRPMDYRSDYYALGFTFFEMLTGELPFVCEDALGYVHAHMARMPRPVSTVNPNVPEMLSRIVAKLVSKQAEDRYQSTEGLRADLERCFNEWSSTKTISEFPLGEHEAYYKLVVSPKIFGRDEEIATLMTTFERVARGSSECLLISGNSGVGKSRLVNEVQWPIIRKKGYFVRGKFDLLQRTTPYTAFIEAFTNLFKHWLCLPETKFQEKREKLNKAMGQYGQVIVEFFPYLEKVMGKQPEIEKLPPEQAQNRFFYHFQNFIECISSPEEPVVMFIDDLQWIDQASINLLEIMLTTQDVRSLLIIGSYRDNEVDESHPFIKLMEKLKKADISIKDIVLSPLELVHTQEFLADSLRMEGKSVLPLAEMVFEKTAGNPFFSLEFLKECFAQKFLTYDHKARIWSWNLEHISSMAGTDNVIDLMLAKINQLPKESQGLLQIGSCLGMSFDNYSLCYLEKSNELEILEALAPLLEAGMVQRIDQGLRYKFIHDRIQQTAYQTVSDKEKEKLHLAIGHMILGKMGRLDSKDELFEVLDHFRLCSDLIQEQQDKLRLAELSLLAGQQAINSGAYSTGKTYLEFGIKVSSGLDWDSEYRLLWDLNYHFLKSLYLEGKIEELVGLTDGLLEKSETVLDKAYIYKMQLEIITNSSISNSLKPKGVYAKAMQLFDINARAQPSSSSISFQLFKIRLKYGKGQSFIKKVQELSPNNDELSKLLSEIITLSCVTVIKSGLKGECRLRLALPLTYYEHHGISNVGALMMLVFMGGLLYGENGDISESKLFLQAGIDLLKNRPFTAVEKAESFLFFSALGGFKTEFRDQISMGQQHLQTLVESGSLVQAVWLLQDQLELYSFSDLELSILKKDLEANLKISSRFQIKKQVRMHEYVISHVNHLSGKGVSLEDVIEKYNAANEIGFKSLDAYAALSCYLSEDYEQARTIIEAAFKGERWFNVSIVPPLVNALYILILGKLVSKMNYTERGSHLRLMENMLRLLRDCSRNNPSNYLHLYLIGQAELARIRGKKKKALGLYQQAIAAAKEHDYLRWTAIANERAGELYLEMGEDTIASVYIHEAIYYYQHWGCMLKVKALNRKYSALLIEKHLRKDPKDIKPGETGTSGEGELDLTAMLKASQAISSEIQLDKLLPRILQVVVESSGADKAAFIGLKKEDWVIESVTEHRGDEFTSITMNEVLTPESDLPEDFISNSIRAGEMETLSDMSQSEKYASLPYVQQYRTKSALCLPIVRDGKVLAALYLENQMTADTFTPERVQLLKALSAQIAISLENARYFEHTQELFRSTERFVPKKFLELLGRNNIEEVAKGDNVKLEMSAIFADLRDFTTISENIEPEQLTFVLNTYLKYMSPIIRNNHGFVNRVLGDGILALFPNDPQDAVKASLEMLDALKLFNQEINAAGLESVQMGIGVNTGPAMLCALGEDERIEANVVSDMVNAASRIEGLNKLYGTKLLISDLTYNKLKAPSKFSIRLVDTVRVKGKTKPLSLYEVLPKTQDESYFEDFQKALNLYTEGKFKAANQNFIKCLKVNPDDAVAQLYAERCKSYQDNAPDNWDGVTTMLEK